MMKGLAVLLSILSIGGLQGQRGSLFWSDNPYFGFSSIFGIAITGGGIYAPELESPVGSGTLSVDMWRVLQGRMSVYGKNNYTIGGGMHVIQTEVFDCGFGYKRYSLSADKARYNTVYFQSKAILFEPLFVNATVEYAHKAVAVSLERRVVPTVEFGIRYAFGRDSKIDYQSRFWGYWWY